MLYNFKICMLFIDKFVLRKNNSKKHFNWRHLMIDSRRLGSNCEHILLSVLLNKMASDVKVSHRFSMKINIKLK